MFGLGGIMVEIFQDISFRFVPVSLKDAREMIGEIKGYPLLKGFRGGEGVNIASLEKLLVKISDFIMQNPEIEELDLNPVFAYSDGIMIVDARIILQPQG